MKKIYLLVTISIIFIYIISCKRNVDNQKSKEVTNSTVNSTNAYFTNNQMPNYNYNPSNSSNPLDSIGQIHNEGVHYIYNHLTSLTSQNILEISQGLVRELLNDNTINLFDTIKKLNDSGFVMNWQVGYNQNVNNIDLLYSKNLISSTCKNYLREFENIALVNKDLEVLINSCKAKESEVISSNLCENEKNLLLGGASVLRYSAAYWFSIAGSQNHIIMTPDLNSDLPNWLYSMLSKKVYDGGWNENQTCLKDFEGFCSGWGVLLTGCVPAAAATAIGAMLTSSTFDIWGQWNGNWGGGTSGGPSASLKGNPNAIDNLGTMFEPRFSLELGNNNSILNIKLGTILRPNSIQILNSNNEIVINRTEIPNFEVPINISNLQLGEYSVVVLTNTNSITKQFSK